MFSSRVFASCLVILLLSVLPLATAQSGSSSSSRHSRPVTRAKPAPDQGVLADNLYRNIFFGISFKIPFGWVDRTTEMRQDSGTARGVASSNASSKSVLLLSVFERPPEAVGETVNSSVLIAAEPVATYPGLKHAAQYFGPLTEVTTSKGFKVVNEPYDVEIGGKRLVRADFRKELGKLTMYQSTLAMIEKAYVVSFTFIAGSEEDVEQLTGNLAFGPAHHSVQH